MSAQKSKGVPWGLRGWGKGWEQLSGSPGTAGLVGGPLANCSRLLPPSASQAGPEPAVKQTPMEVAARLGRGVGGRAGVGKLRFSQPTSAGNFGGMHLSSHGISLSCCGGSETRFPEPPSYFNFIKCGKSTVSSSWREAEMGL